MSGRPQVSLGALWGEAFPKVLTASLRLTVLPPAVFPDWRQILRKWLEALGLQDLQQMSSLSLG